ncbi:X-ray repair cross-complementing protein 5-like [Cimex lectularius]|uniref:VWFA domain-containing protein n=1 Tax=Cimex lectularius TaxID=79782 RepID=A0A8I6RIJ3_CIMLE|nr:X-ray repair cross-complementing protein 5-like [Cimex lectularius]
MEFDIDDLEDDGEESNWDGPPSGRNCVVFLVDTSRQMFEREGQAAPFFKQSIEFCKNALLHICKKETNDLTAIVLYGTEKTKGNHAKVNTVLLQPLGEPTVKQINELSEIVKDEGVKIQSDFGHSSGYSLGEVLQYCQSLINNSGAKVYSKSVILFTNDDNPHGRKPEFEFLARKQAEEYFRHEIEINVVGLGDFDSSKFFKELILTSRGELLRDWEGKDPVTSLSQIGGQIDKLTDKFMRRLSFLKLGEYEGAKYQLQIALYKLYSEPKKFKKFTSNEFNESHCVEDDDFQNSDDIRQACNTATNDKMKKNGYNEEAPEVAVVGGKEIIITKSQLRSLLARNTRGFEVIGFVKTEDIPMYHSTSEPYFIEPYGKDENNLKVFAHLLRRCTERGLSILCWFTLTMISRPVVCALHPTEAKLYAEGREHPPGFIASRLPFSEMMLEPDEVEDNGQPSEVQLKAAVEIVKKTTIPYKVDMFSDFERQTRIKLIESLAFEYEDMEKVDDDTDIDLEDVSNMLGMLNVEFTECPHIAEVENVKSNKRPGTSLNVGMPKLQKLNNPLAMVKNGMADKLTVAQLRELLKAEGFKSLSAMNKSTLVKMANQRFCD